MKKVIFFTAASQQTPAETTAINDLVADQISVVIRDGSNPNALKFGLNIESTDYVAGTVPQLYSAKPVYPGAVLPETSAIVTNGQVIAGYTLTVAGSQVTAITAAPAQ